MRPGNVKTVRSYCRVCTVQCGLLVDLEDDRVVRVRGDKGHPASRGYTCPKGRALGKGPVGTIGYHALGFSQLAAEQPT
jgi:anaerobic selenocysteine-containing dehydrogenase